MADSPVQLKPVKNTTELAHAVARLNGLTNTAGEKIMADAVALIQKSLPVVKRVSISGLGNLVVRERKARQGHNPKTKQVVQIPASNAVIFRVSQELKDSVNGRTKAAAVPKK